MSKQSLAVEISEVTVWAFVLHGELFHVGSLDPKLKGTTHNRWSLEGGGLSVSEYPEAWREIASLGGSPVWALRSDPPAKFLDMRRLNVGCLAAIQAWAVDQGLLVPSEHIEVSFKEEEGGARRFFLFDSRQVALANAEFAELEFVEAAPEMRRIPGHTATAAMCERIGFPVDIGLAADLAATLFIEDVLSPSQGVHGAWWEDELNVHALSAPRGVIHPKALQAWTVLCVDDQRPQPADPAASIF